MKTIRNFSFKKLFVKSFIKIIFCSGYIPKLVGVDGTVTAAVKRSAEGEKKKSKKNKSEEHTNDE